MAPSCAPSGSWMDVRCELLNAPFPMEVTPPGMVRVFRGDFSKAAPPMVRRLSGRVSESI